MTHWATGWAVGIGLALAHAALRTAGLRRALHRSSSMPGYRFLAQAALRLLLLGALFALFVAVKPRAAMHAALALATTTFLLLAGPVLTLRTENPRP
jgi:hypothetical protein